MVSCGDKKLKLLYFINSFGQASVGPVCIFSIVLARILEIASAKHKCWPKQGTHFIFSPLYNYENLGAPIEKWGVQIGGSFLSA